MAIQKPNVDSSRVSNINVVSSDKCFSSLPRAFDATSPSRVKVSNVTIANAALESNALIQARRN